MALNPKMEADIRPVQELVRRLRLPVKNLSLFVRALTHRSYVNESHGVLEDNERLEFLGDAVLGFLVGAWVYYHFPEMPEGDLTKLRSALVRKDQLAVFARNLEIGPALRLGRGELNSGGRERDTLLCGAFEAFIGALYLESGIQAVEQFIEPMLQSACDHIFAETDLADGKTRLQEWTQGHKLGELAYVLVSTSGPAHATIFDIEVRLNGKTLGRGRGTSKSIAEQEAAKGALLALGIK